MAKQHANHVQCALTPHGPKTLSASAEPAATSWPSKEQELSVRHSTIGVPATPLTFPACDCAQGYLPSYAFGAVLRDRYLPSHLFPAPRLPPAEHREH